MPISIERRLQDRLDGIEAEQRAEYMRLELIEEKKDLLIAERKKIVLAWLFAAGVDPGMISWVNDESIGNFQRLRANVVLRGVVVDTATEAVLLQGHDSEWHWSRDDAHWLHVADGLCTSPEEVAERIVSIVAETLEAQAAQAAQDALPEEASPQ